ncbi:hypothetical protein BU15DRAFT_61645 [Melanogaster broomeanus]|nr:hypothetical protein BU15DRAFT_61645 [Melanogaster broomeanus]
MRYMWIPCIPNTVDAAVAAAIEAGDLALALECVVPELAEEVHDVLEQISINMDTLESLRMQSICLDAPSQARERGRQLASRLEELVQRVREVDRFQNFMRQETLDELRDFPDADLTFRIVCGTLVRAHSPVSHLGLWNPSCRTFGRPLAFLPLHAAGIYDPGQTDHPRVFDFVISSYTPSLSALLNVVRPEEPAHHATQRFFTSSAVSQPTTPNQSRLPGTVKEVAAVQKIVGAEKLTWLNGADATITSVLKLMAEACMGPPRMPRDPRRRFAHKERVHAARRRNDVAYDHGARLWRAGACGALCMPDGDRGGGVLGGGGAPRGGMHMAGYASVVATMWSIGDDDAPIVMERMYSYLLGEAGWGQWPLGVCAAPSGRASARQKSGRGAS